MGQDLFAEERINLENEIRMLTMSQIEAHQERDTLRTQSEKLNKEKIEHLQELRQLKGENQALHLRLQEAATERAGVAAALDSAETTAGV